MLFLQSREIDMRGRRGILVTDDESIYQRAMALTQHPERLRRWAGPGAQTDGFGWNYRMHPMAAMLAPDSIAGDATPVASSPECVPTFY